MGSTSDQKTGRATTWPWIASAAAVGVPAVVVLATFAAWRSDIPARMASHWSGSPNGAPDGFSSTGASAAWIGGSCLLAFLIAVPTALAGRARASSRPAARAVVTALASFAGVLAGSWIAVATANLAVDDTAQAHLGARVLWILTLLWGVIPLVLLRRLPAGEPAIPHRADPVPPLPDQRTDWEEVLSSPLMTSVLAVTLAVLVVLAVVAGPWLLVGAVPLALALAVFAQIRVRVDERGLRLVSGLLRLPIKRIPLEQITRAASEQIDPLHWGGWGYRMLPGRSALVLRTGPGLVLDLRDGRRFAVTLDDPDTPARVISGLLARR
ncbi:MAG: hypothetical protein ACTHOD_00955 [Motilibacteraceae bacterium]